MRHQDNLSARAVPMSAYDDFNPSIARLRNALCGRHERLTLAAPTGRDVLGRDAMADQCGSNCLCALARKRVVDLIVPYRIGMTNDQHIGQCALRDLGEDAVHDLLRLLGKFVLSLNEVQGELSRANRLRGKRRAEDGFHFLRSRCVRQWPEWRLSGSGIWLIEQDLFVT